MPTSVGPLESEGDGEVAHFTSGESADAEALGGVLRRIPIRLARCIDVAPGWYSLIIDTDERLAAIDPNYAVLQIKEKFGVLRYYCQPSGEVPTPAVCDALDAITQAAERTSATICEWCGGPGTLVDVNGWLKTLCKKCEEPGQALA